MLNLFYLKFKKMKNNLKYITLDNVRNNPPKKQMVYTNIKKNIGNNSKFAAPQNHFLKKNSYYVYPTIEQDASTKKILKHFHNNINFNSRKYNPSYNKDEFNNKIKVNIPEENNFKNNFNHKSNVGLKPFSIHSVLKNYNENKTILNNHNNEEAKYPSNYSYYEYKYIKKEKKEKKYNSTNKNNIQIYSRYNTRTPNEYSNNISFTSTNHKLNKSTTIPTNQNEIKRSPIKKKSFQLPEYSYKNEKIKTLVHSPSDYTKKIKNINPNFIQRNIRTINRYNYELNKEKNKPPRTPSIDSKNKIHNKLNQLLKENYNDKKDVNNNNLEDETNNVNNNNVGHKLTKIFFIPPKRKYTVKDENHISILDENNNITNNNQIYELAFTKNKEKKSLSSNNTILRKKDKYNNNITISIKDSSEKKNIAKKIDFKTPIRPKVQDVLINSNLEMALNYNNKRNELIKVNKNYFDEKLQKSPNNKIKPLNSNKFKYFTISKNNIIKTIIYKNKNKLDILKKSKNENEYNKEIDIISQSNNTEANTEANNQNIYTYIENNNIYNNYEKNSFINKTLNGNYIYKGRSLTNKEKFENINNNYLSNTGYINIKKHKNDKTSYIQNEKNKNISNLKSVENVNKMKNYDNGLVYGHSIKINKISNNNNNIKPNNKNKKNKIKKNTSTTLIEMKKNKNIENNTIFNSIFSKKRERKIIHKNFSNCENAQNKQEISKNLENNIQNNLIEVPYNTNNNNNNFYEDKITKKKDNKWETLQYKGMKNKTYNAGKKTRNKKKNLGTSIKNSFLKETFGSDVFIKASEAVSIAGKNKFGKKTNQDTYIIEKNINGILNFNIFGVLDGHGDDGHFVSKFVKRYVIHRIKNHPLIKKYDEPKEIYNQLKSKGFDIISKIFIDADTQLQKEAFDSTYSGTTIVLLIQLEEHIICANSGDSRAIAIYEEKKNGNLKNSKIFHLSYDCKPNLPNEKRRIYESGGVVEKSYYTNNKKKDESLPFRVWAKGGDAPGLAMSRSIGDMDAKKLGVIPNPQIVEYTIDSSSKYILICSDGIWEFMSNEEAMRIGNKFYLNNDAIGLCLELCQCSIKLWEERENVIDDITAVVVFF